MNRKKVIENLIVVVILLCICVGLVSCGSFIKNRIWETYIPYVWSTNT